MNIKRGEFEEAGSAIKPLIEKGLVPPNARRVILDFEVGKAVRVLFECYGDTAIVDAVLCLNFGVTDDSEKPCA